MKRRFLVTAKISGQISNYNNVDENGIATFTYYGNKRSSIKSITQAFKRELSFCGCKLEKVIEILEVKTSKLPVYAAKINS